MLVSRRQLLVESCKEPWTACPLSSARVECSTFVCAPALLDCTHTPATHTHHPHIAQHGATRTPNSSRRVMLDLTGLAMRNSEAFGLKEREGEKFHSMLEVIEATSGDLGVSYS